MFRLLTIVSLVVVVIVILAARVRCHGSLPGPVAAGRGRYPGFEKLVVFVFWASFIILAVTGFIFGVLPGRSLTGYVLLTHVTFGGALAGSLAVLAVLRAERYSLGNPGHYTVARKVCFWVVAVAALALILSTLAGMLPILGTKGQHLSVFIHRCSALAALLAAVVYAAAPRVRG